MRKTLNGVSLAALAIASVILGGAAARAEESSTILICKEFSLSPSRQQAARRSA